MITNRVDILIFGIERLGERSGSSYNAGGKSTAHSFLELAVLHDKPRRGVPGCDRY